MAGRSAGARPSLAVADKPRCAAKRTGSNDVDGLAPPPNPYARHPVGARDRSQPGTKYCLWEVLKDHRRGLPISDMLREIVNRGLRTFEGNKNPLGQIAGDLVRDRAHFYHFVGTNRWCLRCYVPQKLLEESGEPPPVPRIAKEARPRPPPDAGRSSASASKRQQAHGRGRGSGSGSTARGRPARAASAGVANAVAAAANGPLPSEPDPARKPGVTAGKGLDRPASAAVASGLSSAFPGGLPPGQQLGNGVPGAALHALLAMQRTASGSLAGLADPQHAAHSTAMQQLLAKQQLVRMPCKIWWESEGQYRSGEIVGYDPSSDLHQVSYSKPGDMDLGVRFLSYEVVLAPDTPGGGAVVVQQPLIVPQLSMRGGAAQVRGGVAPLVPPGSSPAAVAADKGDAESGARLIRPIARSFVTPQPSSPLDTSSPWTSLLQASGGSLFASPAGAFLQPSDSMRPGSGSWPSAMQSPLPLLATLSPPGLPPGFSHPLLSQATPAAPLQLPSDLQQPSSWQQGLHGKSLHGNGCAAPDPESAPQNGAAAALPTLRPANGGLTLQDVVRSGLITPTALAPQGPPASVPQQPPAAVPGGDAAAERAASTGAAVPVAATEVNAPAAMPPPPPLAAAGDAPGSAALAAAAQQADAGAHGEADASADSTRELPLTRDLPGRAEAGVAQQQPEQRAPAAPAAVTVAMPQAEHTPMTAAEAQRQQPAADQLNDVPCARSMAAPNDQQEDAVIQRAPCSVVVPPLDAAQRPSSTLAKRGYDMINGGAPDSGMTAALNGSSGKRPRLVGHADQHFMQQALGVAQ